MMAQSPAFPIRDLQNTGARFGDFEEVRSADNRRDTADGTGPNVATRPHDWIEL
jgi:hypothetical protein